MNAIMIGLASSVGLFFGMLLLLEVGRRIAADRVARDPEGARLGTSAVEGAVFALLGLLVAFTFSGAANRFDDRRDLIVTETNAIGTAYLRLSLLPEAAQPGLREAFRRYLDGQLAVYRRGFADAAEAREELSRIAALQDEIWSGAVAAAQAEGAAPDAGKLLLPALNEMFDITTTRALATRMHPPFVIWAMLFGVALASALLAGYAMGGSRSRSWLHMAGFAAVVSLAVYVIIEIEYPRLGWIRVDAFDQALVELRENME
jgi:hypothetical protein